MRDSLGQPLTLEHPQSLAAVNDFVDGFIASEARAVNVVQVVETDRSPIVQAYNAALQMFAESGDARRNARPFIEKALRSEMHVTGREQRVVAAIAAWIDDDMPRAIALHEEHARHYPRDLVSLKVAHYHLFNRGDSPGMLRVALAARDAAADVPYYHGMLAFAHEQCHQLEEAEAAARHAIGLRRKEPWAHHALAHVMLTQGRNEEGHAFMQDVSATWTGLNSFMETHNWWHQSLFALALDRHDEVLRLYDTHVWGVAKEYSQDQVNAVSLLARVELEGGDVGARWADVAGYLVSRTHEHVLPFLDMHYLYGLARAGRSEADTLMRNVEAHARQVAPSECEAWHEVCVPACRGLLAHARGEWSRAASHLGPVVPRLEKIGGSHAQRDLFVRIHRDAASRASAKL